MILTRNLNRWKTVFDLASKEIRLREIENIIAQDGFWDDPEQTKDILKERTAITSRVDAFNELAERLEEIDILYELSLEESDENAMAEVTQKLKSIKKNLHRFSIDLMLGDQDDPCDAIVSINAGAGGTDSQDWAEMLFRMYSRWVDRKGFTRELIDFQPGDEAGVKNVTFSVKGHYAYGYMKFETGVHRLVRISPYNASGKRHA